MESDLDTGCAYSECDKEGTQEWGGYCCLAHVELGCLEREKNTVITVLNARIKDLETELTAARGPHLVDTISPDDFCKLVFWNWAHETLAKLRGPAEKEGDDVHHD